MKIAIPTDDGKYVSEAFGHARYFLIADGEGKEIEMRHNESHSLHSDQVKHKRAEIIAEILKDVDVVITSHMGKPMIDRMMRDGKIIYIAPRSVKISEALGLYLNGKLRKIAKDNKDN